MGAEKNINTLLLLTSAGTDRDRGWEVPVENVTPQLKHVGKVPVQAGGGQEDTLRRTGQKSDTMLVAALLRP